MELTFPTGSASVGGVDGRPDDSLSDLKRFRLGLGIHAHGERHDPLSQICPNIRVHDAVQVREGFGNAVQMSF